MPLNMILAQIAGILAIIIFALAPQQKVKTKILIFQLTSSMFYALQYLLLGAISAVAINIINIMKDAIFYMYTKKNKDIPIVLLIIYIVVLVLSAIVTFENIFSLFPCLLAILCAYGVWQKNLKKYRIVSVVNIISWIIYNWVVGAYVGVAGNTFQLISAIIAVIRLDVLKKNEQIES